MQGDKLRDRPIETLPLFSEMLANALRLLMSMLKVASLSIPNMVEVAKEFGEGATPKALT